MAPEALAAAVALGVVHVFAGKLRFLGGTPRSRTLSAAGGISVAYVFVHLLPELSEGQEAIGDAAEGLLPAFERHAYVVALGGLAVFYGLERWAVTSRRRRMRAAGHDATTGPVFWLSIASYALYNALIGYLLVHRIGDDFGELILFTAAMGVHFVVNDYGLREHHKEGYVRVGRWILAAALLVGWAVGAATEISHAAIALLIAFLAGGVVLNVLKEELPEERESRFSAFALGAAAYTALLVAV